MHLLLLSKQIACLLETGHQNLQLGWISLKKAQTRLITNDLLHFITPELKKGFSPFWFPAWTRPFKWSNILMTISWSIFFCFILMRRIRFVQCSFVLWPCQICTLCSVYCIFAHLKTSSIQISFEKNDPDVFCIGHLNSKMFFVHDE